MEIEQRALWVARAGAAVAGYALVELVLGLFWDHVALISPLLAMVTWVVCWFSVADREKSWGNFRVITEMLRSVPLGVGAMGTVVAQRVRDVLRRRQPRCLLAARVLLRSQLLAGRLGPMALLDGASGSALSRRLPHRRNRHFRRPQLTSLSRLTSR